MNETPVSKTIQEMWQALVPIIIDLAQNEGGAAIVTMIDRADNFSEGIIILSLHLSVCDVWPGGHWKQFDLEAWDAISKHGEAWTQQRWRDRERLGYYYQQLRCPVL